MASALKPAEHRSGQQRLVLGGMGGVGKTQLAIAFAKQHQHSYDAVLWLNATSEAQIRGSIRSMAASLIKSRNLSGYNDESLLNSFCHWLSRPENSRWLLVLDNYDDPGLYDLRKFLPYTSQGSIIVTTRLTNEVAEKCACLRIDLRPLDSVGEAVAVLATRSGRVISDSGNTCPLCSRHCC